MKLVVSILLLVSVLFCNMGKTGMAISYAVNKTFITKEFCVNKAKPQMKCNGKCYLKKQIAQQEEKQNNNPVSFEKLPDIFWVQEISNDYISANELMSSQNSIFQFTYFSHFSFSLFHPPASA